ncbi:MAG: hypothetical protein ACQESR_09555 [Planctomycetota bacterium]
MNGYLAGLFTIDIEFRSEMSNHLHGVLRPCPRAAKRLFAVEVARRWLTITKLAKCMTDELPVPDEERGQELAKDKKRIQKLRKRLCSISWFMGILSENIARRANHEDDCRGRFWERRFRCRECADPSAILLCGIYVDLNPIKAGEADSPETAPYTSVFQRIHARGQRKNARDRSDGWMAELTLQPENKATRALADSSRTHTPGVRHEDSADVVGFIRAAARLDGPHVTLRRAINDPQGFGLDLGSHGDRGSGLAGHGGPV